VRPISLWPVEIEFARGLCHSLERDRTKLANVGVHGVSGVVSSLHIGMEGQKYGFAKVRELDGQIGSEEEVSGGDISNDYAAIVNTTEGVYYLLEPRQLCRSLMPIFPREVGFGYILHESHPTPDWSSSRKGTMPSMGPKRL